MELSASHMQELVRMFVESDLEELHVELGGARLIVSKRGAGPSSVHLPPVPQVSPDSEVGEAHQRPARVETAPPTETTIEESARPSTRDAEDAGLFAVTSPSVGVFYRRPAPDQDPYVEVGTEVGPDDPVCVISVMKMFTTVLAGTRGRVKEIAVADEEMVEHGQTLMLIEEITAG